MAGLVPAIHVYPGHPRLFLLIHQDVNARDERGHDGARRLSPASLHVRARQPLSFLSEGTHSIAGVVIAMPISPNWLVIWAFLLTGFTPSSW